jgi:hypothetical protein
MSNAELCKEIKEALSRFGYDDRSLVATSLCADEVNRPLEKDLAKIYGHSFSMGGLAGFPFGGVTAFGAMASHIPDGGSCLVVYGPHIGIDSEGNIATVNRRGRSFAGTCCGSAIAACRHVQAVANGDRIDTTEEPTGAFDAQQTFIQNLLLPYASKLANSAEPMAALPYIMFEIQRDMMERIVQKSCQQVAGEGKIALLGGIQINTPNGFSDFFLPIQFDVYDNKGEIIETLMRPSLATRNAVYSTFPGAMANADLVKKTKSLLRQYGYGKSSLLCTSLCCDEVNRPLELDLHEAFGEHFNMGGLAGFPFGGATAFGAMTQHIPDNGSCLIVYGPHIGVDSEGKVGTVNRRGKKQGGACCGSGVAAAAYVQRVMNGEQQKADMPTDPIDAQQAYVQEMLLPYGKQIQCAKDPVAELPFSLFGAQDKLMREIVLKGCGAVPDGGNICLLGGIQINTPDNVSDYFLPLRFDILDNKGKTLGNLLGALREV